MKRDEYLQQLRDNLVNMSDDEKDDIIREYLEYFLRAGIKNEDAAMEELGNPKALAARLSRQREMERKRNSAVNDKNAGAQSAFENQTDFRQEVSAEYDDELYAKIFADENKRSGDYSETSGYGQDFSDKKGHTYEFSFGKENSWEEYDEEPVKKKLSAGKILALVLTFPIWLPLLIAGFAVAFSLMIALMAVLFSLVVGLGIGAIACVLAGVLVIVLGFLGVAGILDVSTNFLFLMGTGIMSAGVGIVLYYCTGAVIKLIKSIFKRK